MTDEQAVAIMAAILAARSGSANRSHVAEANSLWRDVKAIKDQLAPDVKEHRYMGPCQECGGESYEQCQARRCSTVLPG